MTATTSVSHCAKFSDALLPRARHLLSCVAGLPAGSFVCDQFAGVGKGVDYLVDVCGFNGSGVELEPEWADASPYVQQGDALDLFVPSDNWDDAPDKWDAFFTSPTYANRMADVDMRESVAGTYAKSLGRRASEGSSCHMQWSTGKSGDAYREFHTQAWTQMRDKLKAGGWFLLNIKNHIRGKQEQLVSEWHCETLLALGFTLVESEFVPTPGQRNGENHEARVDGEWLYLFRLDGRA